jgi:hypothetical protein
VSEFLPSFRPQCQHLDIAVALFGPRKEELSADEQKLNGVFEEHLRSEFLAHGADQTMETMVANPRINEIPVMVGGDGREEVREFYAKYFLPQIPPDAAIVARDVVDNSRSQNVPKTKAERVKLVEITEAPNKYLRAGDRN